MLAARWLGLAPVQGSRFELDTSTISILDHYRDVPSLKRWNAPFTEGKTT
jgi:hypothetical protein